MKVRISGIDQEDFANQEKQHPKQRSASKGRNPTYREKESKSNSLLMDEVDDEEDEEKVYRMMLQLPDFGTVISLFGIESIEKSQRFVDNLNDPRFQYGIIINKGMTPSERYPKVDVEAWFEKESVRDRRYEELLDNLRQSGYKIVDI